MFLIFVHFEILTYFVSHQISHYMVRSEADFSKVEKKRVTTRANVSGLIARQKNFLSENVQRLKTRLSSVKS